MSANVLDFNKAAEERASQIHKYCQVAALTKLFWHAHLRFASSRRELTDWVAQTLAANGLHIDPEDVLSREELHGVMKDARIALRSGHLAKRSPDSRGSGTC